MDWSTFSISNAAGFIKGPGTEFDDLLRSPIVDTIRIGSITVEGGPGNPGTTYGESEEGTSGNALGLPNPGLQRTLETAKEMTLAAAHARKELVISIAGSKPEEYETLTKALVQYAIIEVNLGCPNVWGEGSQKPIASFNIELIRDILTRVSGYTYDPFDVKVSPYTDPSMIPQVAAVLREFHQIRNVITMNTFPNGIIFEKDALTPALSTPNGYGGIAGSAVRYVALGQARQFATALEGSKIGVVLVGGVSRGIDIIRAKEVGAVGVQVGTAYAGKAKIFSDLMNEVSGLIE